MSRYIHPDTLAALQSDIVPTRIALVKLVFSSAVIAYHSGFGDLLYGGTTYTGLGNLGSIDRVRESSGATPNTVVIGISGIESSVVAVIQSEAYINRPAYIYGALIDDSGDIIGDPYLLFSGTMDGPISATIGSNAAISIPIKSRLADWERARKLDYSDADQQKLYPGDKGFEFVAQLSQRKIIWPRAEFRIDPR